MKFKKILIFLLFLIFILSGLFAQKIKPLKIGDKAPYFELPGVDGKMYNLDSFNKSDILVIVFTCNHCPTSQAYENKIIKMAKDFSNISISFVAISPNDPDAIPLEDLAYSDIGDSFEEMKIRAKDKIFNFPYLYDGKNQEVSKKYGLQATPHVFIFDKERILRYQGRFDNIENPYREPTEKDARAAILALFTHIDVIEKTTKVFGCPVKWSTDIPWKNKIDETWNKKSVKLENINYEKLNKLIINFNDNILLLHIWSLNSNSIDNDLKNIVEIHRMYNSRFFEASTLIIDDNDSYDKALDILKQKNVAFCNYYFNSELNRNIIKIIDTDWDGKAPYTLMIAPEGEILFKWKGELNPLEVKKIIINEIGRYYAND